MSSSASRVWMTTGLPSSAASSSCACEELAAAGRAARSRGSSRARLADGDRARVPSELAQLVERGCVVIRGLVRVDAERGVDSVVPLGEVERRAAGVDARADRDDALDAGRRGPARGPSRRIRARVEVRVGVDHCGRPSILGESSATTTIRIELLEQRNRLAERLPRREPARRPASPVHDS